MSELEWVLAAAMLVGLVGIVVPLVPGLALIWGAAIVWAVDGRSSLAWIVLGILTLLAVGGFLAGVFLPARGASSAGAPRWVLAAGAAGMVVGFFVIPVLGVVVGGPAGIFLAELLRVRDARTAARATGATLKGFGLAVAAQLAVGTIMVAIWAVTAWST
jgi:uncharacterized protein YqgC (DUF456 family)